MASALEKDTLVVFAQASAGLGHLRVTDALFHGLPKEIETILLHSQDKTIVTMHNLMSTHVLLRQLMEFTQHGWAEDVFTSLYRPFLRSHTTLLKQQLSTIIEQHAHMPKTLLIVATHFALAHEIAAIKDEYTKKYTLKIVLIVVVTDDSPQKMWAVGGADLIVVPSTHTKHALERYHASQPTLAPTNYTVLPYMVSPRLAAPLTAAQHAHRQTQLTKEEKGPIHVAVPVSGAAVQLSYLQELIEDLSFADPRYMFHIVSKKTPATSAFLSWAMGKSFVDVLVSEKEREVIDLYERLYERVVIALEITKPSEQAFKALFKPIQTGGSILLFSDPVGRQEWDNLGFLARHQLMPHHAGIKTHWDFVNADVQLTDANRAEAKAWRALRLPSDGRQAAQFIQWSMQQGVFAAMGEFTQFPKHPELSPDGVKQFWQMVGEMLGGTREMIDR